MSRDRGSTETTCAPHIRHGTKLQDILMSDKPNLSYADFHDELTKKVDDPWPKYVGSQQSEASVRRSQKEEELVRYMSNLPSYLEKGMSSQERALNVGVLDWRRLEKWRYSHNQIPPKHSAYSPSSSNASLFSTDGSSTHSSRGQSCSPACQRLQRISMQSEVEASLNDGPAQIAKSLSGRMPIEIEVFGGNLNKFRDSASITANKSSRQQKSCDLQFFSQTGSKLVPDKYEVAATWKDKKKIQHVDPTKEIERLRETKLNLTNRGCAERDKSDRDKSRIGIMPRYPLEHACSSFAGTASFPVKNRLPVEPGEKILVERNNLKDRAPARMLSIPPRSRHRQESNPVAEMRRNTVTIPSEELNATENSESLPKARNPSPIRRLSYAMGKMIKNVGSRENSPLGRSNSKDSIPKYVSNAADSSLFVDNPCSDSLPVNYIRGRSSPLRRLLDPLLKPRASICSEPSVKQTPPGVDIFRSRRHSIDVNTRPVRASESHNNLQSGSTFQALLQVSFKNGLPLFTFAINNEKNILAATIRKSSAPGKGQHRWIYTFFAIHEVKKKSGISWLNQGGKGVNPGIVPNVVAQMKVLDSSSNHDNDYDIVSREFDLFAVVMGQEDENSTDFHPTNELAAIIINLPRITTETTRVDDSSNYDWLDISQESLRENSQVIRSNDNSDGNSQFHHSFPSMNLSTTVILPGGVHTSPSKGEISRLAQRWRSGGLCDCGGWDLGCQLRVYANKKEHKSKVDSSQICQNKDKLQLFSQVGQDNQPVLSMTPFKERVYSVEFSSSISLLQAFAVSVSFIDCRRPPELSEPSNVPEKVTAEVGVIEMPIRPKTSNQAEVPGLYVSYPPHSPVGRV